MHQYQADEGEKIDHEHAGQTMLRKDDEIL
jgi:hypothetical protein